MNPAKDTLKPLKSIDWLSNKVLNEEETTNFKKLAPFFQLLQFISDNHTQFDEETRRKILEITQQMYTKFNELTVKLKKEEEKAKLNVSVEQFMTESNLEIVFHLLNLKVDNTFLKETCKFLASLLLLESNLKKSLIMEHFSSGITKLIPDIRESIKKDTEKYRQLKQVSSQDVEMKEADEQDITTSKLSKMKASPGWKRGYSLVEEEHAGIE